jgi:hypothetical protein
MNNVLVSAGAASIILAVVGGGAKAFGVEVPVLNSIPRQVALALVGVAFLGTAFVARDDGSDGGAGKDVKDYRPEVLAACRTLQAGGLPPGNPDGTFDRDSFLSWAKSRLDSSGNVLKALWARPVPHDLKDDAVEARRAADDWLRRARAAFARRGRELPARFDVQRLLTVSDELGTELRPPAARLEASLGRLAGQECTASVTGSP